MQKRPKISGTPYIKEHFKGTADISFNSGVHIAVFGYVHVTF